MEKTSKYGLENDNKTLRISTVTTEDDESIFTCVATNSAGTDSIAFTINILPYWGEWSDWDECSEICDKGFTERHRICHQVKPHRNQANCIGDDKEVAQCTINTFHCVQLLYASTFDCDFIFLGIKEPCRWSKWSECSRTCGLGQKYRYKGKMIEIVSCMRTVCIEKNINNSQYTPLITYESTRDTNKVLKQLNRSRNQRGNPFRTKVSNHSNSSKP